MLVARINEKRAELENLKQLRDLSAGLATQMQTLEEKLSTLSDGTEGLLRLSTDQAPMLTKNLQQPLLRCCPTGIMYYEQSTWLQASFGKAAGVGLYPLTFYSENTKAKDHRRERSRYTR